VTSFTWDTTTVLLAVALAAGYARGMALVAARGLSWRRGRATAWFTGCASIVIVTFGGLGARAHAVFWVYTVQVLVLLLASPVLLAYGHPLALASDALPDHALSRVLAARSSRIVRVVANPALGPIVVPVVLSIIFFSPLLSATLNHQWAYELLQATLILVGLLMAIGLVGDGTERDTSLALAATVALSFIELLFDAVPGIVMRLRTHLLATAYWTRVHALHHTSALTDQQHAGAALWFMAEFADLPFLLIVFKRWIRTDQLDAVRIDHELDMAPDDGRPWWEREGKRDNGPL
jgi:putative membrane protein